MLLEETLNDNTALQISCSGENSAYQKKGIALVYLT
jgi:hypothetical protein